MMSNSIVASSEKEPSLCFFSELGLDVSSLFLFYDGSVESEIGFFPRALDNFRFSTQACRLILWSAALKALFSLAMLVNFVA